METVYTRGQPGEMPEIIDFINYVFSQAHVPHDFKKLLPKVYGDEAPKGQEGFHYLAKQEGKIVACVACRPFTLVYGSEKLFCGFVGSVSVHPYHRSEGHMKRLMSDMLTGARAQGMDMLILGGQRQRYNYFGFEKAGLKLNFDVNEANVRHALKDQESGSVGLRPMNEEDLDLALSLWNKSWQHSERKRETLMLDLRSWNTQPLTVTAGEETVGYIAGNELLLKKESCLPATVKALMERSGEKRISFSAPLFEAERIAALKDICEGVTMSSIEMINILNWPKVLKLFLEMKHEKVQPIEDGHALVNIEGDGLFEITVQEGKAHISAVESCERPACELSHLEAQRVFFGLADMYTACAPVPASWRGLPFYMTSQDGF